MNDDFYIGYEPRMPDACVPRIRMAARGVVILAAVIAVGVVGAQARFGGGVFEFGRERVFEGVVFEHPYPRLHVGGVPGGYWLVGPGKRGAARLVAGLQGRPVRVVGTLIERDGHRMIQVDTGGVVPREGPSGPLSGGLWNAGTVVLTGEIVDSKCHLGVMKPGDGPLHRDCAMRCLLGGIPPMIVVRVAGTLRRIALVEPDGRPFTRDLELWVARPVRVEAVLYQRGDEEYVGVSSISIR